MFPYFCFAPQCLRAFDFEYNRPLAGLRIFQQWHASLVSNPVKLFFQIFDARRVYLE